MNANTYEQTVDLVVGEFGKQTKAKIYEWIDANAIVVKDRKNKTKEDLYKIIATFKMQNKKKEEVKQINRAISDLKRTPSKRAQRAEEKMVPLRPTHTLHTSELLHHDESQVAFLFKHKTPRVGFCKYALFVGQYFYDCDFDGTNIIGDFSNVERHKNKSYKTLNAWTTSNWREQRKKMNEPKKTVKNNAYKETQFINVSMKVINMRNSVFSITPNSVWKSSMLLVDRDSSITVQLVNPSKPKVQVYLIK